MLRNIFNSAARPPYLPEKPLVLVSTLGDDSSRGDSHGYIGLGKAVAQKLGGEYHYVDEEVLATLYPEIKGDPLAAHLQKIGTPDIIFSRHRCDWTSQADPDKIHKLPFIIDEINENLGPWLGSRREMVAHHLTPEIYRAEGVKFTDAYPGLPRPLIAVMMADDTSFGFSQTLAARIKNFPQSTVFVCSSRRTSSGGYNTMLSSLDSAFNRIGIQDRVMLLGHDLNSGRKNRAYNPYIGLLGQSDHIIVCGSSLSIVSESVSTGKAVHVFSSVAKDEYKRSMQQGLVVAFNDAARSPLESRAISAINTTEQTAEKIARQYRRKQQKALGFWRAIGAYMMDG
ncbi:MAG: mitochondrial fission ELM1 family protein [Micavibrio aeruginosavorus]|nr:mitochondrial fission ELM1 family protein [Micavibrio aeruginosavorus]